MLPVNGPHFDSVYPVPIWGNTDSLVLGLMLVDHVKWVSWDAAGKTVFYLYNPTPRSKKTLTANNLCSQLVKHQKSPNSLPWLSRQSINCLCLPYVLFYHRGPSQNALLRQELLAFLGKKINVLHPLCLHKSCSFSLYALCLH